MAFENVNVPKYKNKSGTTVSKIPYLRIAISGGGCAFSPAFMSMVGDSGVSVDFEFDPVTNNFRLRVGDIFDRKINSRAFNIPPTVAKKICFGIKDIRRYGGKLQMGLSYYFTLSQKEDGFWYGTYGGRIPIR